WLKAQTAVVLPRAFEHTQPRFLNEVFSLFAPGRQVDQIAEETVMILRHEPANEFRVLPSQSTCNTLRLGLHQPRKCHNHGYHIPCIRRRARELRMAAHRIDAKVFSLAPSALDFPAAFTDVFGSQLSAPVVQLQLL